MLTVLRKRYYCEFCKKSGGRKDIIQRHEQRCTLNPKRICGCCVMAGRKQPTIEQLFAAAELDLAEFGEPHPGFGSHEEYTAITQATHLLEFTRASGDCEESCPACVLATIRQFKKGVYSIDWDFKKNMEWWVGEFGEDYQSRNRTGVY
jgi:hypothetical protein